MSELNKYISAFDLNVAHIELCDFHVTYLTLTKAHPKHHFGMHNNVIQDFTDQS